jgi:type II secretory pathway component GspD/PulD (secretin)
VSPRRTARGRRESAAGEPRGLDKEDKSSRSPKAAPPGHKTAPVTITVVGNRLILQSDDPAALALAQELVHLLTEAPKGEGGFEIIRLENANATEAAKVLDEVFNGKPAPPPSPFAILPFFRRATNARTPAPPSPDENKVRIVADPGSNSLLVRASPLDLLTIRQLVAQAIDVADTDSKAVMHSWVLGPLNYASAAEVAGVLRSVFREQMDNNPLPGNGRRGGRRSSSLNVDVNGNPRGVTLAVGVDERTNSLVVNCSERTRGEIEDLVKQLDQAARDATRTVKVIPVKGVDPALIQEAIDAIQGRRTNVTSRPSIGTNVTTRSSSPGGSSARGSGGR